LEPERGTYFGASLDWASDSAPAYARRLGRSAAVHVAFTHFPLEPGDEADLARFVGEVAQFNGIALLTVEPTVELSAITPQSAASLADRLLAMNDRGVPVLVRFAHEMNGSWYAWGQQPTAYVTAFRTLAQAIHERAPMSATLWAPNYGAGYPFVGGKYEARPGTPQFTILDTNHDGVLDDHDDMYGPYYPG
jgi:hypothetical protein